MTFVFVLSYLAAFMLGAVAFAASLAFAVHRDNQKKSKAFDTDIDRLQDHLKHAPEPSPDSTNN